MASRPPPQIPDPSATIPDFGPRPDVAELAKIARAKAAQDARDGIPPSPAATPAKARVGMHPALVAVLGLVVAVVFGGFGFVVAVSAGLLVWFLLGM